MEPLQAVRLGVLDDVLWNFQICSEVDGRVRAVHPSPCTHSPLLMAGPSLSYSEAVLRHTSSVTSSANSHSQSVSIQPLF